MATTSVVEIKSFNQILGPMVKKILSDTGLSDLRVGSVISTILQAAAQSDFEIHASIVQLIQLFSIDTTSGADLDRRAAEFNLTRFAATPSSNSVTIGDKSFVKKSSKIYIGLPPPVVGDTAINVEDASAFPASGNVYIGRGTGNYEGPIAYTSLTNNTSYWTINLSAPVTKNHTAAETVILAQGGNRTISTGLVVKSPANNFSPPVNFTITRTVILVDGENSLGGVPVLCQTAGTVGNVPAGSINLFSSPPFSGATVTNPTDFTNGTDVELDSSLRSRIRNALSLLSRGTKNAILQAVIGVSDATDNKTVVSASLAEPINATTPAQLYIDDGTGFEPSFTGQGIETVVTQATGNEQLIQVSNFPITPPILVAGSSEPYNLLPGQTLQYLVDKSQETITFLASDFAVPGLVKASEIINAINSRATLVTARGINGDTGVILVANRFPDGTDPESMQILGGTANDNLQFPLTISRVMSLYKNGNLLKKNAESAVIYSFVSTGWVFGSSTVAAVLSMVIDGTIVQSPIFRDSDFLPFGTTYKTATASQWAQVITEKMAGVTVSVQSGQLRFASNLNNSSSSQLQVLLSTDLGARTTTAAVWKTGTTVRYSVADTTNIVVGDSVTITGFAHADNNGVFTVTRVAPNDYVECTTGRSNNTDDETGVVGANINPNKEDLALIFFGSAEDVLGQSSDYILNRFSGEIQLAQKLIAGDNITAGSQFTNAHIDSFTPAAGVYNFPVQQDISPEFLVTFDATSQLKNVLLAVGDTLTQGRVSSTANVQLQSNRTNAFANLVVGDYVFIVTRSVSGTGTGYSPWFPSYATGLYVVTQLIDPQTVYIENPNPSFPTLPTTITGTTSATNDVQAFSTNGLIQTVPLSGVNLLPTTVVQQINSAVQFGSAIVFNSELVRIQSNSLDQTASAVFILAIAGSASTLYSAGSSATGSQPHIAFETSTVKQTSFPRLNDGLAGFFSGSLARSMVFGAATSSSLSAPVALIDSAQSFSSTVKIDDSVLLQNDVNNDLMLALRSIDSNTQVTPQPYSGALKSIYVGDTYTISESYKFSPSDKLIVELDQDSTNKTFLVPMFRTGRVFGTTTTTTFNAFDADSASGTTFNSSIWNKFTFQDFALSFRARNIYKSSAPDSSVIIRSAVFGGVGENVQFSVVYPTTPTQAAGVIHTVFEDHTLVQFFLSSGGARTGISAVGAGYEVSRSGNILTLQWAGVGPNPNFSGNGVLFGDIASITDPAFSAKSSFFIGSGKVTAVSPTSLSVKLPGSATISTTYSATQAQDSGGGTTTTIFMPNTGLISIGDQVAVSGFTRSINDGTFSVVGVTTNTSIVVSHSNRTTITQPTSGYRRTTNVALLQFANSVAGQVFTGDTIVVSGLAEPTLNGTHTVSNITTTTFANDTLQFTAAGSDLPPAKTVTSAIWQTGTTVRYACADTTGINVGNQVLISGFTNADNNGTLSVTNVVVNNYFDVSSTRINNTHDESGVVGATARPTYFVTDSGGTVKVLNNETNPATVNLIILQATANGIAAFPLAGTTANQMVAAINANPIVSAVVSAVNALGYGGTGTITNSTFDEPSSVGYNHTPGQAFEQLYDGRNFVLDFTSALVNPSPNFTLKVALQFSHPDYNISTAPNALAGEVPGEYFKLVPTTFRNLDSWFNTPSITSFPIVGTAGSVADGGRLQLSTSTIGSAGAIQVTGGGANGLQSFVKIPASVDSNAIRLQVNRSDQAMFSVGQVVKVANAKPSRKAGNFGAGNLIDVINVNGSTGRFRAEPRSISLANTNSVTITDVSASYGRSSGIIWRWTAGNTPADPFVGAVVGDVLVARNTNLSSGNKTSASTGDGIASYFPIVGVDVSGNFIDVQNPFGVAQGSTTLSGTLNVFVFPAFFVEWKHTLSAGDTVQVDKVGFRNLLKYTWDSGTASPKWASNGASVDDYLVITGNTFLPANRGTFRIVAVADTYVVVENPTGVSQAATLVNLASDVRIFYSESVVSGDTLNVSDLVFLAPNRGSFSVSNYGTDASTFGPYITMAITNSSNQTGVSLTGLPNTFFVTDGVLFSSYRHITNFAADPADSQSSIVYLQPSLNSTKMGNAYNTSITPVQKFSFPSGTEIGIDGYRYYTGLLATVQKVVDGFDPDPVNFPGFKAAGTQIETVPPDIVNISVSVIVKPAGGIALSSLSDSIKAAILNYIEGLGVGDNVIVSSITAAIMNVEGVLSATLVVPSPTLELITILNNQRAKININDITVSGG